MIVLPTITSAELKTFITYDQWCEGEGKYRWRFENGNPRLYYPLEYEWEEIFNFVTDNTDRYFKHRTIDIDNISVFSAQFIANVPFNWMKFKTELEMFSGTLDGTNIDPELFNQGFDRELSSTNIEADKQTAKTSTESNSNDIIGSRKDTNDVTKTEKGQTKQRNINYVQGVQAYDDDITNDNIGELGNNFASNFSDSVGINESSGSENTKFSQGEQENSSNIDGSSSGNSTRDTTTNFGLTEKMRRINYYDNLAFLRERYEKLGGFKEFHEYFEPYFATVESLRPFWK